jgi:two-component system sensor histidine kinase KdpD
VLENHELDTQLDKEQLIHIDGLLVEQVFINLLENAAKYAGAHAKLRIRVTDQQDFVQATVSDTGHGIPKDDIPHIFEKFYKGPQGGLGLGLPICRAIIEVHGGRMWAENNPTGGASFHFTLPKTKNESVAT